MADQRFDYPIPLYGSTLTVLVLDDFHDLSSQADALGVPDEDEEDFTMCRGVCWAAHFEKPPRPGASVARWVIAVKPRTYAEIVAHEATHFGLSVCGWHELHFSTKDNEQEVLCYIVGWAVEAVNDAIKAARQA